MGERRPDGGRAHLASGGATRRASGPSTASASRCCDGKEPNGAHGRSPSWSGAGCSTRVITQNIDGLHARGRLARSDRGARLDRARRRAWSAARATRWPRCGDGWRRADGVPRCDCGAPLKPDVVLFGEMLPEAAMTRARDAGRRRRPDARASARRWRSIRWPGCPQMTLDAGGRLAIVTRARRRTTRDAAVQARRATSWTSSRRCWPRSELRRRRSRGRAGRPRAAPSAASTASRVGRRRGRPAARPCAAAATAGASAPRARRARSATSPARASPPARRSAASSATRAAAPPRGGGRASRSRAGAQRQLLARQRRRRGPPAAPRAAPAGAVLALRRAPARRAAAARGPRVQSPVGDLARRSP